MSRYRQGLSIGELRDRYYADAAERTATEMAALYGTDEPRFLGTDPQHRLRATSVHLGSPLYRDAQGREYTPVDVPASQEWHVRIPPQYARRANAALRAGDRPAEADLVDYPRLGEQLLLTRITGAARRRAGGDKPSRGDDAPVVPARVAAVVDTKARASTVVVFDEAVPSARTDAEHEALERRADAEQRRRASRIDRTY